MTKPNDLGDMPLADLVLYLLDGVSYDRAADRAPGAISPTTLGNLGNRDRPVGRAPELKTLIGAAAVLRTTPWALYHAAGVSMEPQGLTGRPADRAVQAVPMLPAGWWGMPADDFATWHASGRALMESRAKTDLEAELEAERARCAKLEAQIERMKTQSVRTRRTN